MSAQSLRSPAVFDEEPPLRTVLEVEPADGARCLLAEEVPNAAAVTRTISQRESCTRCLTAATSVEGGESNTTYLSTTTTEQCVFETTNRFDCISTLEGVRDGALVVSLIVRDRTVLNEIREALEDSGATVRLRRITRGADDADATVELDAMAITDKQREAAELAVALGYYETPRRSDLTDLADELEVSKSAVSQRLNAVERTLVRKLVDG
ncbi:helix-turn-helix domain-containing protein [Natronococcus sp.]|uniref:helix-turn-helix domain-containing protein n=1 Tax=Natronococcus sp. TaxID=35747 RepID=UPI003A4E4DD6